MKRFYGAAATAAIAFGLALTPAEAASTSIAGFAVDKPATATAGKVEQVHWRRRHRGFYLYIGPRYYHRPYYYYRPYRRW